MESLIILIASVVVAIGFVVLGLTYGRKFKWPNGHRFETEFLGNKAILFVDEEVPTVLNDSDEVVGWVLDGITYYAEDLVHKCAIAIQAVEVGFKEKGIKDASIDTLVIEFQTDYNFENPKTGPAWWNSWSKNVAAYSGTVNRNMWGSKLPRAVIRSKYMKTLTERGQPVIHELVHILNKEAGLGYERTHTDANLWLGPGGHDSVEGIGVIQWKDLL